MYASSVVQAKILASEGKAMLRKSPFVNSCFIRPQIALLICVLGSMFCLSWRQAKADSTLRPVRVFVGDKPLEASTSPLTDGNETFVPLDILGMVGAQGHLNKRGDAVEITYGHPMQEAELAVARPEGKPMLALSDLARLLPADILTVDSHDNRTPKATSFDEVYLLARVTDVRLQQGAIRFTTSFPVPYQVRMIDEDGQRVGYVDCLGAKLSSDEPNQTLPDDDPQTQNLRVGQFKPDVVRVAVNLPLSLRVRIGDGQADAEGQVIVVLWKDPKGTAKMAAIASKADTTGKSQGSGGLQMPTTPGGETTVTTTSPAGALGANAAANPTETTNGESGEGNNPASPNAPSATKFVQIQRIVFEPDNDQNATLRIFTTGPLQPSIRYTTDGGLQLDLPGAVLALTDSTQADQSFQHPLLTEVQAIALDQTPPVVRIRLRTPRYDGFVLDPRTDQVVLRLRLPRNATGVLADKLIVLDPGHGGSATGATAGGYAEKNITLAIALKLRRVLEACGARVVMTRDRDRDVDLSARPALANSIHADFFISIHNDACSHPGEASGTTTYYHMEDPSSRALANCVQQAVAAVTGLPSRGARSDSSLYQHGLAVLRESQMPAILIEVAYIDNPVDRRKLIDPNFQEKVAEAICRGLRLYIEGHPQTALLLPADR